MTSILRELRQKQTASKQLRRAEREQALAAKQIKMGMIGVIYAPHPWTALPSNLAKDCVLFLGTPPQALLEAMCFAETLGFKYKSNFAWIKDAAEPGDWFRNEHELILVCTRGKVPAPAPGTQSASIIKGISAPLELIARYFPNMPAAHGHGLVTPVTAL
jgi:hypothetical protein